MTLLPRIEVGFVSNDGLGDRPKVVGQKINTAFETLEGILEGPIASADSAAASAQAAELARDAALASQSATATSEANAAASAQAAQDAVDSIEGLNDLADLPGQGLIVHTGIGTYDERTLTGSAGLGVTNGNGVAGNPTITPINDLGAVEALSGTGIARRIGSDAWTVGTEISTAEIADDAVTYAKLQNVTQDRVLGRYTSGSGNAEEIVFTPFMRTVADDPDAGTVRATIGVAIGSQVQAYDPTLAALAGVTTAADKLIYATGSDAFATTDLTATARTLLDDGSVSAMRTTLGVAIGSNVQAWDADLDGVAAVSTTGIMRRTGAGTFTAGTQVTASEISDQNVTLPKIEAIANNRVLGNVSGVTASPVELTGAQVGGLVTLDNLSDVAATATKGNLLAPNGTSWSTLGVGTDGQVLTADSASPLGLAWGAGGGGGGGGAPTDALYLTLSTNATLSNERVATAGTGISFTDAGAGSTLTIAISDAELLALAGLTSAANKLPYFTGSGTAALADFTSAARTLVAQASQADMRTTGLGMSSDASAFVIAANNAAMRMSLGLGTIATLSSINDSNWSGTDLSVANGGTGASTLTNHGVLLGQGTSAVVATSAGTAGQVLTSNGASADPTWQTPGAAVGYTLAATNSISGNQATITFTSIPSFNDLIIEIDQVIASATANFQIAVSTNNGSSYTTARQVGQASLLSTTARDSAIFGTGFGMGLVVMFGGVAVTAGDSNSGTNPVTANFMPGAAVNAIQLSLSTGTFSSGTIRLYTR